MYSPEVSPHSYTVGARHDSKATEVGGRLQVMIQETLSVGSRTESGTVRSVADHWKLNIAT